MRDHLLFIDTETSGLPGNWQLPYGERDNWPYAVQVAWVIYSQTGQLLKKESHYVSDQDFDISPGAFRVHGLTHDFLLRHGESRHEILRLLAADLNQFEPLVVGHFMQLDYHVLSAEFYRTGIANPLERLPVFCTMLATAPYVSSPQSKYLRLNRLYYVLFHRQMPHQHEALADAQATADCFFEMRRLGDISDLQINRQQAAWKQGRPPAGKPGCLMPLFASALITVLLSLLL